MILYPSMHIKDGVVARLTRSSSDSRQAEVLHPDPAARAASFEAEGFQWLNIVDLDAAYAGHSVNTQAIDAILKAVKIPVQLSGGMHDLKSIEGWLKKGVKNVILASAAVEQPQLVRDACREFPGSIVVKIDAIGGFVATTGWREPSTLKALDLALRVEDEGAVALIYSDINMDGALSEVDSEAVLDLAYALTMPVIASGGIHSLQDIADIKRCEGAGVSGVILGRALFTGAITAAEALALAAKED